MVVSPALLFGTLHRVIYKHTHTGYHEILWARQRTGSTLSALKTHNAEKQVVFVNIL